MAQSELFSSLTAEDIDGLRRQREAVRLLIRDILGENLTPSLSTLQRLIDVGAVTPDDTWRLQALGVCFGDILADRAPLQWGVIEDEWGRDQTLRWEGSAVNLNALTMISKRIEDGEHPDLEFLADEVLRRTRALVERGRAP